MKKYVPNMLTFLRIIFTPFVIFLGLTNHYIALIVVAAIIAFTDAVDGFLARRWHVVSELGAKLDAIADKMLAIGLLIILIIKNSTFFYVLLLECCIALLNLYFYFKKRVSASLLVGKFKTWIIFITILLGFAGLVFQFNVSIFIYITVILQVITLISYLIYGIQTTKLKKKEIKADYIEFYELIEPILIRSEMQKRKNYPHHINESVYAHVLRVAYDCYRIGKRFKMDYKSLAVAGILHDFYENPWQYSTEKKSFFQKHAFTHAREAVENSKKVFGRDIVTPKVESIMITHMFPLNKRIPRNREAWLLTLVDKADSIDFIMHPVALFKIFFHKEYDQSKKLTLKKIKKRIESQIK